MRIEQAAPCRCLTLPLNYWQLVISHYYRFYELDKKFLDHTSEKRENYYPLMSEGNLDYFQRFIFLDSFLKSMVGIASNSLRVEVMLELVSLNELILSESAMDTSIVVLSLIHI